MRQPPYLLDIPRREAALRGLIAACSRRGWTLLAAHVRTNHLHAVIAGPERPDRLIATLKAYCSRSLNAACVDPRNRIRWSRGGSRRGLWRQDAVNQAVNYVLTGQGEPMETYPKLGAANESER